MESCHLTQINYICDVASSQNLFENGYLSYHEKGLIEKSLVFESSNRGIHRKNIGENVLFLS